VDGFLTAPVPVEGTLLLGADVVIAVYLDSGAIDAEDGRGSNHPIVQYYSAACGSGVEAAGGSIIEPDVRELRGMIFRRRRSW